MTTKKTGTFEKSPKKIEEIQQQQKLLTEIEPLKIAL
jgi:hypothetical protein